MIKEKIPLLIYCLLLNNYNLHNDQIYGIDKYAYIYIYICIYRQQVIIKTCFIKLLVMEALFIADRKPPLNSQEEGIEIEC